MTQQYENRETRARQIAQAALTLMCESGLRRMTTKATADKVGISDGTVFRHFKNKEEIVLAAMELLEEKLFAQGFPDDADPLLNWRTRNMGFVTSCLAELESEGQPSKNLKAQDAAALVQGHLLTFAFQRILRKEDGPPLRTRIDGRWRTLVLALGAGAPLSAHEARDDESS